MQSRASRHRIVATLLWLWVVLVIGGYVAQFHVLAGPILSAVRGLL